MSALRRAYLNGLSRGVATEYCLLEEKGQTKTKLNLKKETVVSYQGSQLSAIECTVILLGTQLR